MSARRGLPLLVAEYLPDPARQVLKGAGCSFISGGSHRYLHRAPVADIGDEFADKVVAAVIGCRSVVAAGVWAYYPLGVEAVAVSDAPTLRHPIGLLEWLAKQPPAQQMQIGANAYLLASDPDDILNVLPFHLQPRPDDRPANPTETPGWSLVCCAELSFLGDAGNTYADTVLVGGQVAIELT